MPILDDIMDHDLFGPAIRQGRQEGGQDILRGQLNKRFGAIPSSLDERLNNLSAAELKDLSLRLLDAKSLDELFTR